MKTFGKEMRRIRKEAGKRLIDVAEAWAVSVPFVSDVERDRRQPPSVDKIRILVDLCDRSDQFSALARLATRQRNGEIRVSPQSPEVEKLIYALAREDLSSDQVSQLLEALRSLKEQKH